MGASPGHGIMGGAGRMFSGGSIPAMSSSSGTTSDEYTSG
jgi:hypothetical protein